MRPLSLTVALMFATCVAGTSNGSKPRIGEACPIGVSLWSIDKIDPDGLWSVAVRVWSEVHAGSEKGEVRITVSPETDVVEGALRKAVHPGRGWKGPGDKTWLLRLRRKQDGPVVIRAALRLPGKAPGDHYDYESRLILQVSGASVVTKDNSVGLAVKTEKGRRFRYGGQFSVALDPDDPDAPVRVEVPPEILSEAVVVVKAASMSTQRDIDVAVTVSKSGKVTWVHPRTLATGSLSDDVWEEVTAAVSGFAFRPARSGGRAVTENAVIRVRLVPVSEDEER